MGEADLPPPASPRFACGCDAAGRVLELEGEIARLTSLLAGTREEVTWALDQADALRAWLADLSQLPCGEPGGS